MESQYTTEARTPDRRHLTLLVEEDRLVRRLWEDHYRERKDSLVIFENPLEFLEQIECFSKREEKMYFFLDQDFGRIRGVGVQVARALRGLNFRQNISLVTNHIPECFIDEVRTGLIQYVFDKYPEPIFGPDYFFRKLNDRPELLRMACPPAGERTALERSMGFEGDRLEFTLEEHFPQLIPQKPSSQSLRTKGIKVAEEPEKKRWWLNFYFFRGAEA